VRSAAAAVFEHRPEVLAPPGIEVEPVVADVRRAAVQLANQVAGRVTERIVLVPAAWLAL
jgi:hypothetical protein